MTQPKKTADRDTLTPEERERADYIEKHYAAIVDAARAYVHESGDTSAKVDIERLCKLAYLIGYDDAAK